MEWFGVILVRMNISLDWISAHCRGYRDKSNGGREGLIQLRVVFLRHRGRLRDHRLNAIQLLSRHSEETNWE